MDSTAPTDFPSSLNYIEGKTVYIGDDCAECYPCRHKIYILESVNPCKLVEYGGDGKFIWEEIRKNPQFYTQEEFEHFSTYQEDPPEQPNNSLKCTEKEDQREESDNGLPNDIPYVEGKTIYIGGMCKESYPCQHEVYILESTEPLKFKHAYVIGKFIWEEIKDKKHLYSEEDYEHFSKYEDNRLKTQNISIWKRIMNIFLSIKTTD